MHIAGPILHPQDVARLGHVGEQRIVAGILAVMGIEAAEGPAHRRPRADHGAIDIDREARQRQAREGLDDEVVVELDERGQRPLGELPQPVAHRARRGQARQPAEARDQRIAGDVAQVLQPARAHVQQCQHEQSEPAPTIISARRGTRGPQPLRQVELAQVAAEQFQPAIRGQLLVRELHMQRPLDHPGKLATLNRIRGVSCVWGVTWGCPPLRAHRGPFCFTRSQRVLTQSYFRIGANSNGRKDRDGNSGSTLRRLWRVVGGNVMGGRPPGRLRPRSEMR